LPAPYQAARDEFSEGGEVRQLAGASRRARRRDEKFAVRTKGRRTLRALSAAAV
jgi:hypothetical protein